MKYIRNMSMLAIALIGLDLLVNYRSNANFKPGECGANILFPGIRKIESVDTYVYNYTILGDNNKKYSMRINDFDRIMEKTKCRKENK